jgi:hypothetical protein
MAPYGNRLPRSLTNLHPARASMSLWLFLMKIHLLAQTEAVIRLALADGASSCYFL